jgi:hypothetical protein
MPQIPSVEVVALGHPGEVAHGTVLKHHSHHQSVAVHLAVFDHSGFV